MAALKVYEFRVSLEEFANLYDRVGLADNAAALRLLSRSMARADKVAVDDVLRILVSEGSSAVSLPKESH